MPEGRQPGRLATRRLMIASVLLGIFVLFDLGLLGWLIFRSLSQREIERVLLETRREGEQLAEELAGGATEEGQDLYTLIATEQEKQTYIDTILQRRELIHRVEIYDTEGRLVFRARGESFEPPGEGEIAGLEETEVPPRVEERTREHREQVPYDMDIPIGDLGILHIGISQAELEERVEVLRGELTRQTGLIGAVTLVVLLLGYLVIGYLWRRGRRLEEQAREAERLAYLGTLASGLAHEIRNPLNSLNLNMQLLEEEGGSGGSDGSGRRLLALTRQEIGRLERLVTDFLSYAKPRPLELQTVPAVVLLRRCRDLLAGELEACGASAEIEELSAGSAVRVDPAQFSQLLMNLVQNSLAATEEAGRPARITLRARRTDGRVSLEVEDNGVGIPEPDAERIFDLFYSTRKGGTGLGLAVVKRIAKDHGGELEVESAPGVGTRIRVTLPQAQPQSSAASVAEPLAEVPS